MTETAGGCVYDGIPLDGVQVRLGTPTDADGPLRRRPDEDGPLTGGPDEHGPLTHGPDEDGPLTRGPGETGPDGREATRLGVVHLAGPVLARGYVPADPDAFVVVDGVRWFRTPDLGELVDGVLHVHGRADDVIISGGVNVAPAAVEAVLATLGLATLGIGEVCVVGVPDPEWGAVVTAVVVPGDSVAPDLAFMHDAVAERLGPAAAPRALILVDRLPYRGPGKVDRAAVTREAAALVEGTHED
jgi:O-succinylbenzoic acid--CoA ligase